VDRSRPAGRRLASREWLRWQELDRQRKRSTVDDYRSAVRVHLDATFGELQFKTSHHGASRTGAAC